MRGDDAPVSHPTTEEIVAICRRRIEDFRQLAPTDRDDVVQHAVAKIVDAMGRGAITNVAAYCRRVAYHCAVDAWRRAQGPKPTTFREDEGLPDGVTMVVGLTPPTPEDLTREKRRVEALRGVADELRELLESAPENYRRILVQHYLDGQSFESLVEAEIRRRIEVGQIPVEQADDPDHRLRVRNAVHAWHSRALRWLQQRAPDAWREVTP